MTHEYQRHDIVDDLYVYLQPNSKRWYSRFKLYGKWYAKATKEKELDKAIERARLNYAEYKIKLESNQLIDSKYFKDVAERVIKQLRYELEAGIGKVSYRDYIQVLNKYHIEYFGRMYITSIDQDKIREFEKWRFEQNGRQLAKSTLMTHNAALNMVFKEAIDRRWMIPAQVPVLSSKSGEIGTKRAAFSENEYYKVLHTIEDMKENSRKEVTRQIRELLECYVEFVAHTGIRPGTEMEALTWGDIEMEANKDKVWFSVKIRKGKTTKHTGTRTVMCKDDIFDVLDTLRDRFPHRRPTDKLFRLANGETTKELGVSFRKALEQCELKDSADGPRSLYSLRHSYITWQLKAGVKPYKVAKQCGTSESMIEQHYSHITPYMFGEELTGVKLHDEPKKSSKRSSKKMKMHKERIERIYKEWEAEYRRRGCI